MMERILRTFKKETEHGKLYRELLKQDYTAFFDIDYSNSLESYWLDKPFAMAAILEKEDDIVYHLLQPKLTGEEFVLIERIHRVLRDRLFLEDMAQLESRETLLFEKFVGTLEELGMGLELPSTGKIWYHLRNNFLGYERLDPILRDPYIEDISCNGYNLPVFVYHKAYGSIPTNIMYSQEELDRFVLKLSQKANSQVSLERPLVDATLPTGARVQITYRNVVSTKGSSFTVRMFSAEPITPLDLVSWNTISAEAMAFLWIAVENGRNMIIVGGTASGKTTMMNAVSFFIPTYSKIVSLEDTREIQLPHQNWLPMVTRDVHGRGKVEMFDLLKAALRQRPEYIIVGEIRGREAATLFQAMNTGHAVYSTLHAGDIESAVNRLIHDPINIPIAMFAPLDLVATLSVEYIRGKAVRRLTTLHEVWMTKRGELDYRTVFERVHGEDRLEFKGESKVLDDIGLRYGMDRKEIREELRSRAEFLRNMLEKRPVNMHHLLKIVDGYRKEFYRKLQTG
ncbi:type II/IV secretion system ATPase subunit [Archaeoglobus neptunius]|uniref:type II/IV secretion system ATPase subunit n=1 Tax=Archaeoglobus neptunius TaxID=2798580 RepID=UPI001925C468|nr:type II/IV secretion system ATPase subunit [Archaeoglobus neptunius]